MRAWLEDKTHTNGEVDYQEVCLGWCPRHLISEVIPQTGFSRIERWLKRKGIVSDFKFPGWRAGEEKRSFLVEFKGISCNKSWYPRTHRPATRAVDRRAVGLTDAYERKENKCDNVNCGTEVGQVVTVLAKLNLFGKVTGLCFGKWAR